MRVVGRLGPVMAGARRPWDTCLPIIAATAGERYAILAVFSGMTLTLLVPVLVPRLCRSAEAGRFGADACYVSAPARSPRRLDRGRQEDYRLTNISREIVEVPMMSPGRAELTVTDNVPFGETGQRSFYALTLECPDWSEWHPGQFVMVRPQSWGQDMTWARPLSICRVTPQSLVLFSRWWDAAPNAWPICARATR